MQNGMNISGAFLSWNTKKTAQSEKGMGTTKQQEWASYTCRDGEGWSHGLLPLAVLYEKCAQTQQPETCGQNILWHGCTQEFCKDLLLHSKEE